MKLRELKEHIGSKIYVKSKPGYTKYEGVYTLDGIQVTIQKQGDGSIKTQYNIAAKELKRNCSIWLPMESTQIQILSGDAAEDTETEELSSGRKPIRDIQTETLQKLKSLK